MSTPLRVLFVEDSVEETALLVRQLRRGGYDPTFVRVDSADVMNAALGEQTWDIVIADYNLARFSTPAALDQLRERGLDPPFIIVSADIGEERAASAIRAGAYDYIDREDLMRFVPAVERAVREAEVHRAQAQADERIRTRNAGLEQRVIERTAQLEAANNALDRALAEVELLNTVMTAAAGEDDLGRILSAALHHVGRVIPFTGGSVALVEDDALVIRAAVGPFAERALGLRQTRGKGRSWQVVETAEPLLSNDVTADGLKPTNQIRSYLAVPLIWRGRAYGIFEIDSTEANAFDARHVPLMQRVTAALSGPIELARRYAAEVRAGAEAEAAKRRLETEHAVTRILAEAFSLADASPKILQTICESLGWQVGILYRWDPQAEELRLVEMWHVPSIDISKFVERSRQVKAATGKGLLGRAWTSGKPAWIPDVVNDPHFQRGPAAAMIGLHGAFAFPIHVGSTGVGIVECLSGEIRQPDDDLLAMMEVIGSQIGQFIERKRAEDALRQAKEEAEGARWTAETRFAAILDVAVDAIVAVDADQRIIIFNNGAERIFGYRADEALGQSLDLLLPPRLVKAHRQHVRDFAAGPDAARRMSERGEISGRRKDGSEFPAEASISKVSERGQTIYTVILRDITERRWADEEIRTLNAQLEQRVAERTAELREARDEAERASRAKSEFLSRMSHELRTPLNAILGFGQLLQMDSLTADQAESVEHILKGGHHLLDLINEVLDIARIESGGLALAREPVPLEDVVRESLDLIAPLATERNIQLNGSAAKARDRHVMADYQRLKQVLLNLLSNAVKYNREGGGVTLSCEETSQGRIRITVSDTGPGIPPEKMKRLFTPFERLGAEQTGVEGTGIGLTLSKRLVEAMEGEIGVESEVGRGSTFWVELAQAEGQIKGDGQMAMEEDSAHTPAEAARAKSLTVLYIEDNLSNLELVQRVMSRRPEVNLLVAMQGRLGLDLAGEHRPDLILLDLHLPDITGDEVLRLLREDPTTREIPVVMVSADATPGQIRRLLAAGAKDYLTKPLDVRKLLGVLDETLKEGAHASP